jgi:hypothetical protein
VGNDGTLALWIAALPGGWGVTTPEMSVK